jgi:hypothetical protein
MYFWAAIASIALSLRSKTPVMSTNVLGWKPQSSGWCGSK